MCNMSVTSVVPALSTAAVSAFSMGSGTSALKLKLVPPAGAAPTRRGLRTREYCDQSPLWSGVEVVKDIDPSSVVFREQERLMNRNVYKLYGLNERQLGSSRRQSARRAVCCPKLLIV